jgi:ferric-dicitrate binding protein FerR (iron transport regulator)
VSRFHDFLETITWWDNPHPGQLSPDERSAIAGEAAHWFVTLEEAGMRERAQFLKWARRSPHHLTAYFDTVKIDAQLKSAIDIASLRIPDSADPWSNLNRHPLAIIVAAVLTTGGIVWAVSDNIRVRPATQQIEMLEQRVAKLQSQLAVTRRAQKTASADVQQPAPSDQKQPDR